MGGKEFAVEDTGLMLMGAIEEREGSWGRDEMGLLGM